METITKTVLDRKVEHLNRITNSPAEPYTRMDDGTLRANVGNYHLSSAYGGYSLHRMCNESGGAEDVLRCGHTNKRRLFDLIDTYIMGMEDAKR